MGKPYVHLDKSSAIVLLDDYRDGLLFLERVIDPGKFKRNVLALADMRGSRMTGSTRGVAPTI